MPQLVGAQKALTLILAGKTVSAAASRRIGLSDKVVPAEDRFAGESRWLAEVRKVAESVVGKGGKYRRRPRVQGAQDQLLENTAVGRAFMRRATEKMLAKKLNGNYPAQVEAADVILRNLAAPSEEAAFRVEAEGFARLMPTPESKNLMSIFFLNERAKRLAKEQQAAQTMPVKVTRVGVIGAGIMGSAIAQLNAQKAKGAVFVGMKDIRDEFVANGMRNVEKLFGALVKRRSMTVDEAKTKAGLVKGGTTWAVRPACSFLHVCLWFLTHFCLSVCSCSPSLLSLKHTHTHRAGPGASLSSRRPSSGWT